MTLTPITERTQYCVVDCGKEICKCKPPKNVGMNKEKTAMQILIEELDVCISNLGKKADLVTRMQKGRLIDAKMIAKRLLQKEQEQIEQAYKEGGHHRHVCEANGIDKKCYCRNGNECNFARYITEEDYYQSKYGGGE